MFCYHCGATQPDNTTYCSNCGRPAKGPAQPQTPSATSAPAASAPAAQPSSTPSPTQSSTAPGSPWLNVPPMAQPAPPQAYQPYLGQPQTDGKATGSLILGILSLFFCFSILAGIPAVILGHMSRKNIRQSMGRLKGDGMALAGLIMGYISFAAIPLILIIAAIAIPNFLRAKITANDSTAASVMRTVNTAQVTYTTNYPAKGYAHDLATLGPGPSGTCSTESETYACALDGVVANRNEKAGYRFNMTAVCDGTCTDYLVVAAPITEGSTGSRTYCSTSDAVIRYKLGNEIPPSTPEECQTWPPLS